MTHLPKYYVVNFSDSWIKIHDIIEKFLLSSCSHYCCTICVRESLSKKFHFYGLESEKIEKQRAIYFAMEFRYVINTLSHICMKKISVHEPMLMTSLFFFLFSLSHTSHSWNCVFFALCFVCQVKMIKEPFRSFHRACLGCHEPFSLLYRSRRHQKKVTFFISLRKKNFSFSHIFLLYEIDF